MSKLTNKELKEFVEGSYKKRKDTQRIGSYKLDTDLSTRRNKLYYDKDTGKAIHAIAGTDRFTDWFNNLTIPYRLHHHTQRYKRAEAFHKAANTKYGKKNVGLVTHSQSGNIAENLTRRGKVGGEENVTLNPAIIGFHDKGLKVVKSMFDPVSLLTITNKRDEVLAPTTYNPITEHSTKILEGRNIIKTKLHNNNNMKDKLKKMYEEDSDSDDDDVSEQSIIRDIAKLSHDIHKIYGLTKPPKTVIKGISVLVDGIDESMSMIGTGKSTGYDDVDKFNAWSKAIGQKFLPINKNIAPIKHVMTKAAVRRIKQEAGGGRSRKAQVKDVIMKDIPKVVKTYKKLFSKKKGKGLEEEGDYEGEGLYVSNRAGRGLYAANSAGRGLHASGGAVGRPKKGSPEAIAWGEKMRAARLAKKK